MSRKDLYTESCGALIYHAKQLRKGKNVIAHLRRAKIRLINIENELNIKSEEKKKLMTIGKAAKIVYDKIPAGSVFSGTKLAKQAIFLTGRINAHKDSVLRELRELRENGVISYKSVESKPKSLYMKEF